MKKKILVILLVLVIIISANLYRDYVKNARDVQHIYLVDIRNNTIEEIGKVNYGITNWPKESDQFRFDEVKWLSNETIWLDDVNSLHRIYNVKGKEEKLITPEELNSYIALSVFNQHSFWDESFIREEELRKIKDFIGKDYFRAVINYSRDKVVFDTQDFNVYVMDLNTNKAQLLFRGMNFKWSPGESKISFLLPKHMTIDEFDSSGGGTSETMLTYVYDFNTGEIKKVAEFGARVEFSPDENNVILIPESYFTIIYA